MRLRPVSLNLDFADTYSGRQWDAYERLLMDVIRGKLTLFMRRDELDAAWRWIEPVLDGWEQDPNSPCSYTSGTWGPRPRAVCSAATGTNGARIHEHGVLPQLALPEHIGQRTFEDAAAAATALASGSRRRFVRRWHSAKQPRWWSRAVAVRRPSWPRCRASRSTGRGSP